MNSLSATDSYLNLLLSFPHLNPMTVLAAVFLAMARLLPIMVLAPFFGTKSVPNAIKIMFSLALVAIILPQILLSLKAEIPFDILFIGYFIKELFLGFVLGFLVAIPFYVAQGSGSLTDFMRGAQSLQVTDPTTSSQTGPVGILYNYVLIAIFFIIGGPFLFIEAVGKSFSLIPINHFFNPGFFTLKLPFWQLIVGLLNYILGMSIQLAAPALIGVLMAEMFLGIANRLAPQIQIVFLGISLKSWVGLGILSVAWYFIVQQLAKESFAWLKIIESTLRQLTL